MISRIFTPNNVQFESYIERIKYLMVYRLTLIFTFVFLGMAIAFYNVEFYALLGYLFALGISTCALIYLLLTHKFKGLYAFFAIFGTLIAHFSCNFSLTTSHYVDFLWMIISSFLAFIGMGKKWGVVVLAINCIGIGFFMFYSHNRHIAVIEEFTSIEIIGAYVEIILAFFIMAYLMHQFMAFQNYSEARLRSVNLDLEAQNAVILSKNKENSTLVKEIHHRVKNNLQIIISLLRLQQNELKSEESKEQFAEAINRVMVMSSIHQRLYQEKDISKIDWIAYVTDLSSDLIKIYSPDRPIELKIDSCVDDIDLKTLVPLGLLLNELVSNSLKYAFQNVKTCLIYVGIKEVDNKITFQYADSGIWIEKKEDNPGFGMELIEILTEQLGGNYRFNTDDQGTKYEFVLNKLN